MPELNLRTQNLVLRLPDPPGWVAHDPRAPLLIDELTRSGFFQQEVERANVSRHRRYFKKTVQIVLWALIICLFFGILYFYDQHGQDTENFYYVASVMKDTFKKRQKDGIDPSYWKFANNAFYGVLTIFLVHIFTVLFFIMFVYIMRYTKSRFDSTLLPPSLYFSIDNNDLDQIKSVLVQIYAVWKGFATATLKKNAEVKKKSRKKKRCDK